MVAQICATEGGLNGTKAQSRNPKAQIGKKPFNYGIVDKVIKLGKKLNKLWIFFLNLKNSIIHINLIKIFYIVFFIIKININNEMNYYKI